MAQTSSRLRERHEHFHEGATMALYVAICLLGALVAVGDDTSNVNVLYLIWGTTIGLALAHWFAFRLSALLMGEGEMSTHHSGVASAQLLGAAAVAAVASIPVLLLPDDYDLGVVKLLLAGLLGAVGYAVARSSGAERHRAAFYGLGILIVATIVAVLKIVLSGY